MRRQKVLFLLAIACYVGAAAFGTARLALPDSAGAVGDGMEVLPELHGTCRSRRAPDDPVPEKIISRMARACERNPFTGPCHSLCFLNSRISSP